MKQRNNISLIRSLLEHDLSGHSIIIENHSDVSIIGKSGTILSESKQMLIIQEEEKEIGISTMISKRDGLFAFLQGDLKLTVQGSLLLGDAKQRKKKKLKRW